ncbi:MAG: pentapeptide repeat-containing protein [Acidobacteriaceae bacterium]
MLGSGTNYASANIWRSVNFTATGLRGAVVNQAIFGDTDFSKAKLDGVAFRQCSLNRVTFAGRLRGVVFDGREISTAPASPPFRQVDMRDAILDMCEVRGCEFVDSVFPSDEDLIAVPRFPEAAERALQALASDSSLAAGDIRAYLGHSLHGPTQSPDSIFLLNLRDLREYPAGEETVRLAKNLLIGPD